MWVKKGLQVQDRETNEVALAKVQQPGFYVWNHDTCLGSKNSLKFR